MDYLAVVSLGTYPDPTVTSTERAALAASYGLLVGPLAATIAEGGFNIIRRLSYVLKLFKIKTKRR